MVVLVVAGGLVVAGCDAAFVKAGRLPDSPARLTPDTVWARDNDGVVFLPMNRCDAREIRLLGWASDPDQPQRQVIDLAPLIFRPADINLDGREDGEDFYAYIAAPYDYNLDRRLDGNDYLDLLSNLHAPTLCE